jgi:hypothetical protein
MPYIIGFGMRGQDKVTAAENDTAKGALEQDKVTTAENDTAKGALEMVRNLQRSDEEIKFIKSPSGREISVEELATDAQDEETPAGPLA